MLPNHQSTADVPLLMSIFTARIGFTNKVMWIMDRVFKFTNFGVISWMHDDFFIRFSEEYSSLSLSFTKTVVQIREGWEGADAGGVERPSCECFP